MVDVLFRVLFFSTPAVSFSSIATGFVIDQSMGLSIGLVVALAGPFFFMAWNMSRMKTQIEMLKELIENGGACTGEEIKRIKARNHNQYLELMRICRKLDMEPEYIDKDL